MLFSYDDNLVEKPWSDPMRVIIFLLLSAMISLSAHAEIKTYTKTIRKIVSSRLTADDAKVIAVAEARRAIIEEVGTYIQSVSQVEDGQLTEDNILAVASGILNIDVVDSKKILEGDLFGMEVTVKADLDTGTLQKSVNAVLDNKQFLEASKAIEQELSKQLSRIAELEKKAKQLETELEQTQADDIKAESRDISRKIILTEELINKAHGLGLANAFGVKLDEVIDIYNKLIKLNPDSSFFYYEKSINLKMKIENEKLNKSPLVYEVINDLNKSITIEEISGSDRNFMMFHLYAMRSSMYFLIKSDNLSIQDSTKSLMYFKKLNKSRPLHRYTAKILNDLYIERGFLLRAKKDYQGCIDALTNAIDIQNGQIEGGIIRNWQDFTLENRGKCYLLANEYENARDDFEKLLKSKPREEAPEDAIMGFVVANSCYKAQENCKAGDCNTWDMMLKEGACK